MGFSQHYLSYELHDDVKYLTEIVTYADKALQTFFREDFPLVWAKYQLRKAQALQNIGDKIKNDELFIEALDTPISNYTKAVSAFELALEELKEAPRYIQWVEAKNWPRFNASGPRRNDQRCGVASEGCRAVKVGREYPGW
jgi:tetratricopeptide (TPR) repeat protein